MESVALPDTGSSEPPSDFRFAFDSANFSDRILRIEILPDFPGEKSDPDDSLSDLARNRKRRREDQLTNANDQITELSEEQLEQFLSCNVPDLDYIFESQEEARLITEEAAEITTNLSVIGHEATQGNETSSDNLAVQVRTLHISSPILAAKSPFFYKLFSNGMRESEQLHVTLRIQASEETALMHLLNFMYSNALPSITPAAILDVLMAADKFEVSSCMRYCSRLLRNLPMTCESAFLYLDLPSSVLMANTVKQLTDAAKQFLAARFKDLTKFPEEVLNLPLAGIEAVLSSDDLQVTSEDAVYDFVLNWARKHYPNLEERRGILSSRLLPLVRFPCMTCRKLRRVLASSDVVPELATSVVLDALFYKAEAPYRHITIVPKDENISYRRYVERAYKYRPVKVVEFQSPCQQCVVYLDLKREECAQLFPHGRIYSQAFHLGGHGFFLSGHCSNSGEQLVSGGTYYCFGLFLGMQEKGTVAFTVNYEFAARMKPSEKFVCNNRAKYAFTGGKAVGFHNLFSVPWAYFIADDSPFFINGVLHLRADLTIKK